MAEQTERPETDLQPGEWQCPDCGRVNHGDVCAGCGHGEAEACYREWIERDW